MSYPPPGQHGYPQQPHPAHGGYGQPQPQPGYGHPAYLPGYPGYYPGGNERPERANPFAGVLLLLGGIAGLLVGLLPWAQGSSIGVVTAFDAIDQSVSGDDPLFWLGLAILACAVGGLIALVASFGMFMQRKHGASAASGLIGALLMLGAAIATVIVSEGQIFESEEAVSWIMLICGIPALVGALVGFRK